MSMNPEKRNRKRVPGASERIARAVDAVYAMVLMVERGGVLGHDSIQAVLGVTPHTHPWDRVMTKVARRLLREQGIAFQLNHVGGYKLCTVEEQIGLPVVRLQRAIRQTRRGRIAVEAIPEKLLSPSQRQARNFLSLRNRDAEHRLEYDAKVIGLHLKEPERLPRPRRLDLDPPSSPHGDDRPVPPPAA